MSMMYESIGDGPTTRRRKKALCGVAVAGVLVLAAATAAIIYLWVTSPAKTSPPSMPQVTQVAKRGSGIGRDSYVIYAATGCRVALLSFDTQFTLAPLAVSDDLGCSHPGMVVSLGVSVTGLDAVVSVGAELVHLKTKPSAWAPTIYRIPTTPVQSIGRIANAVRIDEHEIYFYVYNINASVSAVGALNVSNSLVHQMESFGVLPHSESNGASDVVWDPAAELVYVAFGEGLAVYSFNSSEFEFMHVIHTSTSGSDGMWLVAPYVYVAAGSRMHILDLVHRKEAGSLGLPPQYGWAGGVALRPANKSTVAMLAIDIGLIGVDVTNVSAPALQWVCKLGDKTQDYLGWNLDVTTDDLLLSDVGGGLQIFDMRGKYPKTVAHYGAGAQANCAT